MSAIAHITLTLDPPKAYFGASLDCVRTYSYRARHPLQVAIRALALTNERSSLHVGGAMGEKDISYRVILVVDDQADNRELLNTFLSSLGYGVVEACNGLEAIKVATLECPDLIIMDLSMPVMDGFNAVQILRKMPVTSAVPVVACTAIRT